MCVRASAAVKGLKTKKKLYHAVTTDEQWRGVKFGSFDSGDYKHKNNHTSLQNE